MIISIEQRRGKLIVSYINKEGNISYMQFTVPPEQQYTYVYSKQRGRSFPGIMSWDNKPVVRVPTEFLSRHRIQEFFIDAGEILTAPLFELNNPNLYSCDIEVDVSDEGFAEAGDANNRINTISWCKYPEVIVFGLKILSGEQCESIEKEINNHIKSSGYKYKFLYKYFENESDMLYDLLFNYAKHAPLITGWNFWNYDWRYIYNRCKKLHLDISWMSPTRQWYKHRIMDRNKRVEILLPQHKLIVDYMEIYKKWDRIIDPKENNSLDFAGEAALGISKVKYPGTFQDLYNKDYDKHVFYNAIDSIIVELLHFKLKTMGTFLTLGNITRVETMNAWSPINMLEATLSRYAYKRGLVFPQSKRDFQRESYEGAFVFNPVPNLYGWVAGFDYQSMYPHLMMQFKISIENFITKDKNFNTSLSQIKCSSGAIFDASKEPLLPEILKDYYQKRKDSKKISLKAEKESEELEKILKDRERKSVNVLN